MNTPKCTEDLSEQISQLVERYVSECRRAARDAVDRAFGAAVPAAAKTTKPSASPSRRTSGTRRTPEEVADLGARLYERVRARPGESMVVFAAELEMPVRDLQRPMTLLKRDGRVRSVGQRHLMRYFPAVGSKAAASAS
jgi:hypothetical protein